MEVSNAAASNAAHAVAISATILDRSPSTTSARLALDPGNTYRGTMLPELDLLTLAASPNNEVRPIILQITAGTGRWDAPTYTVFADGTVFETVCGYGRQIEDLPVDVIRLLERGYGNGF